MPTLLRLAYDGGGLSGCPEVAGRRTVVGEVRAALGRAGIDARLETLSRTDAGVHARAQVAVAALERPCSPGRLLRTLDHHLPPDVRCTAVAEVAALPVVGDKTYRYTLDASPFGDAFLAGRAWRVRVDVDRLAPLAALVVGTHDFAAFRRRGETRVDLVRTVSAADWSREGDALVLTIRGGGFPYRLVRSLVGAMVAVARGAADVDALRAALAGRADGVSRQQAPARGLCLEAVRLDPEPPWATTLDEPGASVG